MKKNISSNANLAAKNHFKKIRRAPYLLRESNFSKLKKHYDFQGKGIILGLLAIAPYLYSVGYLRCFGIQYYPEFIDGILFFSTTFILNSVKSIVFNMIFVGVIYYTLSKLFKLTSNASKKNIFFINNLFLIPICLYSIFLLATVVLIKSSDNISYSISATAIIKMFIILYLTFILIVLNDSKLIKDQHIYLYLCIFVILFYTVSYNFSGLIHPFNKIQIHKDDSVSLLKVIWSDVNKSFYGECMNGVENRVIEVNNDEKKVLSIVDKDLQPLLCDDDFDQRRRKRIKERVF